MRIIIQIKIIILVFSLQITSFLNAQDDLKCGIYDNQHFDVELERLGDHWGYGYEDLLEDISNWEESPYVLVNDIGYSVEGRPLWQLKITDPDIADEDKKVVFLHARTHPVEVQSTWVCNEIIAHLLSDDSKYVELRKKCIFFIVPMLNPDGVEFEYPRENANGIDLESNWFSPEIQPEVICLKLRFRNLMLFYTPVDVAINLHSALACKRYFVYHHENGTSIPYTELEKRFIGEVQDYFPEGIEDWNYYISWTGGTPFKYPESWWWLNFGENVLALTYEDMNCEEADSFELTAQALLLGIADYLELDLSVVKDINQKMPDIGLCLYPNFIQSDKANKVHFSISRLWDANISVETFTMDGFKISSHELSNYSDHSFSIYLRENELSKGMNIVKIKIGDLLFLRKIFVY